MSDLISRQAVLDAIYKSANDLQDVLIPAYYRDLIKELPTAQPAPQWIPVSERLPEDYVDVLVWFEYFRYGGYNRMYATHGIGNYSSDFGSWMINHESGWHKLKVFAWMPLPKPYREEA